MEEAEDISVSEVGSERVGEARSGLANGRGGEAGCSTTTGDCCVEAISFAVALDTVRLVGNKSEASGRHAVNRKLSR